MTHCTTDQHQLLDAFRSAAAMPWYDALLRERGVESDEVTDLRSFSERCPVLTKENTFQRFSLDQLAAATDIRELASVLTSSGHGGRFSFGVSTRAQAATANAHLDHAFDCAFGIKTRSTLAINCLPMGVGFGSECMTVATTSVREDMAVALVESFGRYYEQIMFAADPLFMKRLTDYSISRAIDWSRYRINTVLGEEIFGEHFRDYIASCFGLALDREDGARIVSSFGIGELGLHLCYETAATIAMRRAVWRNRELSGELLGWSNDGDVLPTILAFNPERTFIEVIDPDADGYGMLTFSMLDPALPIPLLRYQSGDIARLLEAGEVRDVLQRHVPAGIDVPRHLIALKGRRREALPNGSHVGVYKDALYADTDVAREITGAFRATFSGSDCTLHVQLTPNGDGSRVKSRLLDVIPPRARPHDLTVWAYAAFPFGMTIDYERKFPYHVAGTP